jgi:hypothetical protein
MALAARSTVVSLLRRTVGLERSTLRLPSAPPLPTREVICRALHEWHSADALAMASPKGASMRVRSHWRWSYSTAIPPVRTS